MRKKLITSILSFILISITFLTVSFGWFFIPRTSINSDISGGLVEEYFHTGSGKEDDPFVITRPLHYYHMVEFFQRMTILPTVYNDEGIVVNFGNEYLYFQIGCPEEELYDPSLRPETDENTEYYVYEYSSTNEIITTNNKNGNKSKTLNLEYYSGDNCLMPLGSSEVPFYGSLNGNDIVVKNINITSKEDVTVIDANNNITTVTRETSDIGIFGFVPEDSVIENIYFDNVNIYLKDSSADETINTSVSDIKHEHLDGHESDIYVGYIAGHVKLGSNIQHVYINNCKILGGSSATNSFGYFGYVDDADGAPVKSLGSQIDSERQAGDDAGFGGSMDMTEIYNRLTTIWRNADTSAKFPTVEKIYYDEETDEIISDDITKTSNTNIQIYKSGNKNVRYFYDYEEGSFLFYEDGDYNYIYGKSSSQNNSTNKVQLTIYTYTITTDYRDVNLISDGNGNYLSLTFGGDNYVVQNSTSSNDAIGWIIGDDGYIYYDEGDKFYLTFNSTNRTLTLSLDTPVTTWSKTEDGGLYTNYNGVNYYIIYNGSWGITNQATSYSISDGNGNFLYATNTQVSNRTNETSALIWQASNIDGDTTFYIISNNTPYFLSYNGSNLTMSTTQQIWSKDENGYYVSANNLKMYIVFNNGTWQVRPEDYYLISDGNSNYLSTNNTNIVNSTSNISASSWFVSSATGNTTFSTVINNQLYYLSLSNGSLSLSTTSQTWSKDENGYYVTSNNLKYYLTFYSESNSWNAAIIPSYLISNGKGVYLSNNSTTIESTTDKSAATCYILSNPTGNTYFRTIINNRDYYLNYSNGSLTLSTTSQTWTKDGNKYYVTVNNEKYYLNYVENDGMWEAVPNYYYIISDGNGHYLMNNGTTGISATTNQDQASHWYFSTAGTNPSGYISTIINETVYYLNHSETNGFQLSQTKSTSWSNDGSAFYYSNGSKNLYLTYENNDWNIVQENYYLIKNNANTNYLCGNATTISNTANETLATHWYFSTEGNNPSGNIYTYVNGKRYYLHGTRSGFFTYTYSLDMSETAMSWKNENGIFSCTISNYYTRYLVFDTTWSLTDSEPDLDIAGYYISSGNNYLAINGTDGIKSEEKENATVWTFSNTGNNPSGTISTTLNDKTYYLVVGGTAANRTITVSETSQSWTNNSGKLSTTAGTTTVYIRYNSGWTTATKNSSATKLTFTSVGEGNVKLVKKDSSFSSIAEKRDLSINDVSIESTTLSNVSLINVKTTPVNDINENKVIFHNEYPTTKQKIVIRTEETTTKNGYDTYFPISVTKSTDENYDSSLPYRPSNQNTGYIVGGGNFYDSSQTTRSGDIRISRYAINGNISNSYSNSKLTTIYTINDNGLVTINDTNKDNYTQYETASEKFLELLKGKTNIDGLHFMNSEISMDNIITAPYAKILGREYYNYQLPEDSIDFKVVQRGTINFFAGTYFSGNNAFFSLHHITRDSKQNIVSIKEISKVYQTERGSLDPFIYLYTDGTYSTGESSLKEGYSIAFDLEWITNPSSVSSKYIYYFEIPCNQGEYALGSVKNKTGAYLIYLDIGSNGGAAVETVVSSEGNEIVNAFNVEYRSYDMKVERSILQLAIDCPEVTDDIYFNISVNFDPTKNNEMDDYANGLYTITVVNKSTVDINLTVYLVDDDDELSNNFPYAYQIIYENKSTSEETVLLNSVGENYWKSMNTFLIPSEGDARENSFSS